MRQFLPSLKRRGVPWHNSMKETIQLQCPCCGWVHPTSHTLPSIKRRAEHHEFREFRFANIDPAEVFVVRRVRMGGREKGSKRGKVEFLGGLKLGELPGDLKEEIRGQCRRILELVG